MDTLFEPASSPRGDSFAWSDPPLPGESLLGFVARNGHKHGLRKMATVLLGAGIRTRSPEAVPTVHFYKAPDLARAFRAAPDEMAARFHPPMAAPGRPDVFLDFFGAPVRRYYRDSEYRRVSPRGLATAPYHRAIWDLAVLPFCPETKERPIDACPAPGCAARLAWKWTVGVHRCETCGADLRDFPQPLATFAEGGQPDIVTGLIDPRAAGDRFSRLDRRFVGFERGELFEFAMALAWAMSDVSAPYLKRSMSGDFDDFANVTTEAIGDAGRLLTDWDWLPTVAERFLAVSSIRGDSQGLVTRLGRLAYVTTDPFVHEGLRRLLADTIDVYRGSTPSAASMRGQATLTFRQAEQEFGISHKVTARWARDGVVAVGHKLIGGATAKQLLRAEIEDIVARRDAGKRREDAAAMLGVHPLAVVYLSMTGQIARMPPPMADISPRDLYAGGGVECLRDALMAAAGDLADAHTTLIDAFDDAGLGDEAWTSIFDAVLSGSLNVARAPGAGDLPLTSALVLRDAHALAATANAGVRPVAPADLEDIRVEFAEAGRRLGVAAPVVSGLVKAKLMKPNKSRMQRLDLAEVERFRREYMFTHEIAKALSVATNLVEKTLGEAGVASIERVGDQRAHVYRRAEVEAAFGLMLPLTTIADLAKK